MYQSTKIKKIMNIAIFFYFILFWITFKGYFDRRNSFWIRDVCVQWFYIHRQWEGIFLTTGCRGFDVGENRGYFLLSVVYFLLSVVYLLGKYNLCAMSRQCKLQVISLLYRTQDAPFRSWAKSKIGRTWLARPMST